ncbi:uncharacterized protein isoform X2 [Leptinotarsa decemlineata]|uniref:uncharacterized protein isoform X2 n=1 Tax=Leptinotarsa decemlineata TaxID=7539 RepID=UPI003D30A15F
MFCWWQDCPPAMEGPCRDKGPFSACLTVPANPQSSVTSSTLTPDATTKLQSDVFVSSEQAADVEVSSEHPELSTFNEIKHCVVMGRVYQIGDRLPHDTGNCLECICGQGAKVTCSPHQCAPAGDEINDYRLPGPRQPVVPDIF